MKRIVKDPEERKKELLDAARKLFEEKGYMKTSVSDITESIDVAKGTFYYYFETKEDILKGVIDEIIDKNLKRLDLIVKNEDMDAIEKMREIRQILTHRYREDYGIMDNLDRFQNSKAHYNWLVRSVEEKSYLISKVIEQGIDEGLFKTAYSFEISQIMTLLAIFLFDPKIFTSPKEAYIRRLEALEDMLEKSLSVSPGTFKFVTEER